MRKVLSLIALRLRRNILVMAAVATVATAFAGLYWQFDILSISDDEASAYDAGLQKFELATKFPWNLFPWAKVEPSKDITLIAMDDESVGWIRDNEKLSLRYGNWPYDRVLEADLVRYFAKQGVRGFVFDATIDERRSTPDGDNAFRDALLETGLKMYLGFNVHPEVEPLPKVDTPVNRLKPDPAPIDDADAGTESDEFPTEPTDEEKAAAAKQEHADTWAKTAQEYAMPIRFEGGLEAPVFPPTDDKPVHPRPPIPQLLGAITGWGTVEQEGDGDGKLRSTRFAYSDGVNAYPTLPVAIAADLYGAKEVVISPGKLQLGDHAVRIDPDGSAKIDYRSELKPRYGEVKLAWVIQCQADRALVEHPITEDGKKVPDLTLAEAKAQLVECDKNEPGFFKNKVVVLAGVGTGMGDVKSTPLESNVPGVVKQVATLQNLLDGHFIIDAPFWFSLLVTFVVAFFSSMLVLAIRNPFVDIGWPLILYIGFFVLTGGFLLVTHLHVLSAMPGLGGTLASILTTSWERLFANRERERLKEMFQNYMESDLVELMVERKALPKLDGENMRVTAFFSDIRGFSTFSERYHSDPRGLMKVLNRYFSAVTPVLHDEGACIDKYVGDSVVALFGAPVPQHDHAFRACKGALLVQEAVKILREQFREEGLPDMFTRVGLNTDEMCVGNIGSDQLLDYTAIGDGMNLASRLEGVNKVYGTFILMGEGTYKETLGLVEAREVDLVRVAGKHEPTRIYELLSLKGLLTEEKKKVVALYAEALTLYRARDFGAACAKLDAALLVEPTDGPSHTLYERCTEFQETPPPPEWDGVSSLEK